jgi:hypothetical protein
VAAIHTRLLEVVMTMVSRPDNSIGERGNTISQMCIATAEAFIRTRAIHRQQIICIGKGFNKAIVTDTAAGKVSHLK